MFLTFIAYCFLVTAFAAPTMFSSPTTNPFLVSLSSLTIEELLCDMPVSCDVSKVLLPLPANQTTLNAPPNQTVFSVAVGRGIQNYTCTAGTWVTAGALANLYDVSCFFRMTAHRVEVAALSDFLSHVALMTVPYPQIPNELAVKYRHLFIDTPNSEIAGAISPEFVSVPDVSDKVVTSKTASLNSPNNATVDIPWLQLTAIPDQGKLASSVYRLYTANGQPPATCLANGSSLSVEYSAVYYFLK